LSRAAAAGSLQTTRLPPLPASSLMRTAGSCTSSPYCGLSVPMPTAPSVALNGLMTTWLPFVAAGPVARM
jgi:hypothetical protein